MRLDREFAHWQMLFGSVFSYYLYYSDFKRQKGALNKKRKNFDSLCK